jgi:hypothetical protein
VSALVIDASIAIKWVIEEEGTNEALALRNQALAAPDLLIAECANILWKKVRRRELSDQEAEFAARLLARADIDLVAMRPYLEAASGSRWRSITRPMTASTSLWSKPKSCNLSLPTPASCAKQRGGRPGAIPAAYSA